MRDDRPSKSDDADFARAIGLRPKKPHSSGDVTRHLIVRNSPCSAHLRTDIVRTARTITKVQMRGNRRIAVMGEFTDHLGDPFIPARQMMDDDHPGKLPGTRRAGVVGLATVAVVADESHGFGNQGRV